MTIDLFITMFTIGSLACTVLTEAIKQMFANAGKEVSPNLLALIDAVVVGVLGTTTAYILMGVEWNTNNIICLVLMAVCIWLGSMLSFDKIKQLLEQIRG